MSLVRLSTEDGRGLRKSWRKRGLRLKQGQYLFNNQTDNYCNLLIISIYNQYLYKTQYQLGVLGGDLEGRLLVSRCSVERDFIKGFHITSPTSFLYRETDLQHTHIKKQSLVEPKSKMKSEIIGGFASVKMYLGLETAWEFFLL